MQLSYQGKKLWYTVYMLIIISKTSHRFGGRIPQRTRDADGDGDGGWVAAKRLSPE